MSSKNYIKPGKSRPLANDGGTVIFRDANNKNLGRNQIGCSNIQQSEPRHMTNRFASVATSVAEAGRFGATVTGGYASNSTGADCRNMNSSFSKPTISGHGVHNYATNASHFKGFQETVTGGIDDDDDDILQVYHAANKSHT